MSTDSLAYLKANSHRNIMVIDNLITPPNSAELKPSREFQDDHGDVASEAGDFAFHRRTSSGLTATPLFQDDHHTFDDTSLTQAATEWSARSAPDWEGMARLGIKRPHGVQTWQELQDYEARRGNPFTPPTKIEYEQTLQFLTAMMFRPTTEQYESSQERAPKRRRVQSDGSSRKRHTTSSGSIRKVSSTPEPSGSGGRRRQSKASAKVSGAEGRSARAPSTKEAKDPEWRNYPDFAPSFDNAPKDVMVIADATKHFDNKDNKKGARDLSNDPEIDELHPAEAVVASWLHLDCHRYHTSKRQIFQGYVGLLRKRRAVEKRIQQGLEQRGETKVPNWNKTEAQKLLGIDVSKGSWIWQFYKDIGWFEPENEYLFADALDEE